MNWWKRLPGAAAVAPSSHAAHLIYVKLPEPLDPLARGERYEDPLDAELRLAELGCVSGGGTLLSAPNEDGSRSIDCCGVDVDTDDLVAARALLRRHLPELGCRPGTQLEYRREGSGLCDVFDGEHWSLGVRNPPVGTDD